MNQKSNRKNCIQRILAIILSLLMLLQTCSVFAEDIEIPENTPAETAATVPELIQFCTPGVAVIWVRTSSAIFSNGLIVITASGFTASVSLSMIGAIR